MALSDEKLWDLWNAQGTDDMSKAEAFVFARAIEAEVQKQNTALIEAQAREIAALKEQVEGLRKDAEALQSILDHGISLTVNLPGKYVVARRGDSREAWSKSIHSGDVRAAALAAISAAMAAKGGSDALRAMY